MMLGLSLLYIKAVLMAGKAHKLGCPKIVLDHDHMCVYVCALRFPHHWLSKASIHQTTLLLATVVTRLYQPCSRVVAPLLQPGYNCCKQQCIEALRNTKTTIGINEQNIHYY